MHYLLKINLFSDEEGGRINKRVEKSKSTYRGLEKSSWFGKTLHFNSRMVLSISEAKIM